MLTLTIYTSFRYIRYVCIFLTVFYWSYRPLFIDGLQLFDGDKLLANKQIKLYTKIAKIQMIKSIYFKCFFLSSYLDFLENKLFEKERKSSKSNFVFHPSPSPVLLFILQIVNIDYLPIVKALRLCHMHAHK